MPVKPRFLPASALSILTVAVLAGCSNLPELRKVATAVQPYQMDRVQGNVVSREQVAYLQPGMPKRVVQDILGTPLLNSVFHSDRWDYVFSLRRQGAETQMRHLTVFFKDGVLQRYEADELPSETEFVASLKSTGRTDKLPPLEASPQSLEKFPAPVRPATAAAPAAPVSANYPPLEPATP